MNFSLTNKNKQRQIRKKIQDDNDELNSNNLNNNDNTSTTAVIENEQPQTIKSIVGGNSKRKNSNTFSTKQKSTSSGGGSNKSLNLFSFDNDEDQDNEETDGGGMKFNPIITTKRNDSLFEDSKAATINNESYGKYTTEMINSLKKNSASKPPSSKQQPDTTIDNIDDIDKMEIDHQQYVDQTNSDTNNNNTTTSSVSIPSSEQIKLFKEKRQRARDGKFQDSNTTTKQSSSSDFLSLKVIGKDSSSNVNNKDEETSRIVREEDDDEMEEEYNILNSNTIKFGDPGKSTLSTKKEEIKKTMKDINSSNGDVNEDEDSDEDEELTRWRLDQIRKGGGSKDPQIQSIEFQRKKMEKDLLLMGPSESALYKSSSNITSNPKLSSNSSVVVSGGFIDSICKDLNSILVQLKEVKHNHQSEFDKVQEALRDAVTNCSVLESDEHLSQDQYVYYDELKQYCNNMIDCLGEKIPQIEELEDKYIELLKDHAHDSRKQFKTRLHDIIQDIQENGKSTSIIMPSNNNNNDDEDDAELDEFGRDRNHYEKHSRKKRLEQYKKQQQQQDEEDDFKLNDESDEKFYSSEKIKIIESIKEVMVDVDLEYSDISEIASKFKHWKSKDLKSYTKSQMPFIMPSIFAPFIRLQMIEWSPLSNVVFDSLPWYNDLFNYSESDDKQDDGNGGGSENQDDHLIPKLVEKIIIPKTETFITYIWNPLSKNQTNNLKNTIDEILVYQQDSSGNEDIKFLFSQIISTLKYSVGNGNLLIPFSNRDLSFSIKMFKHSIAILNNIKIWSDYYQYIPLEQLLEISDEIIDFQVLPYLRKIYLNNSNGSGNSNINQLFELFESFYQYLLNLPWSSKKYKSQIHLLLLEFSSFQTPGGNPDLLLSNDNLEKLNNLYIPFFSQ